MNGSMACSHPESFPLDYDYLFLLFWTPKSIDPFRSITSTKEFWNFLEIGVEFIPFTPQNVNLIEKKKKYA